MCPCRFFFSEMVRTASLAVLAWTVVIGVGLTRATARDIYVNNTLGDDRKDGLAARHISETTGPVRTIARALAICQKGDRIVLAKTDRPYRESLSLSAARHSGYPGRPFVIEGNGAVLEGAEPVPKAAWRHWQGSVFRFRPVRLDGHMLFLDQRPAPRRFVKSEEQLRQLPPRHWAVWGAWVYFSVEPRRLPFQYPLTYSVRPAGITLYQVRHVVIQNLTIQGFRLDGVHVADRVTDCALGGLLCRGNGRSGVYVGGASQVVLAKSLLGSNGRAQLMLRGYARVRLADCELIPAPHAPAVLRLEQAVLQKAGGTQPDNTGSGQ